MVWPTDLDRRVEETGVFDIPGQQIQSSQACTHMDHILRLDITAPPACQRLTGIVATIGKSSRGIKCIEKMIAAGMNIALINFHFGTNDEHVETIKNIREAAKNYSREIGLNCPVAIAGILPSKKIRTGKIVSTLGDEVKMLAGETMRLTTDNVYKNNCTASIVYVDYLILPDKLIEGDEIYLDETIKLTVESISKPSVLCKIDSSGFLGSYKDVILPNIDTVYTNRDKQLIEMTIHHKLDILIAPLVHSPDAITELRQLLGEKGKKISIVANIESIQGFHNLDAIIQISNGIMITRNKIEPDIKKKLVIAQKNMIIRANKANIPVFINAHVLSSMRNSRVPLRSELHDIANFILDGTDTLVLSAETAIGLCPIETIKIPIPCDQTTGTVLTALLTAQRSLAAAIIVLGSSGQAAQVLSKFKPRCPIIAVTRIPSIARKLHMWRAVIPLIYEDTPNIDWEQDICYRVKFSILWAIQRGFMRATDPVVLVCSWGGVGVANSVRVENASEFLD